MEEIGAGVGKYMAEYPGDEICALQVWYEGLEGCGVPNPEEMTAIEAALAFTSGWTEAGDLHYEKFGVQKSYKRVK